MIDPKRRPEDLTPEELAACRRLYRKQIRILAGLMLLLFAAPFTLEIWASSPYGVIVNIVVLPWLILPAPIYGSMMRCPVCGHVYSMSGIWKRPFGVLSKCPRCGFNPFAK